ncbi:MAG: hypothetical protein ABJE95_16450 [Byssovorax sp.]
MISFSTAASSMSDPARREDGFALACETGVRCVCGPAWVLSEAFLGFACRFALGFSVVLALAVEAGVRCELLAADVACRFAAGFAVRAVRGVTGLGEETAPAGFAVELFLRVVLGGAADERSEAVAVCFVARVALGSFACVALGGAAGARWEALGCACRWSPT